MKKELAILPTDVRKRRTAVRVLTPAVHVGVALGSSLSEEVAETVPGDVRRRACEDRLASVLVDRVASRLAKDPLGTPSRLEEIGYDLAAAGSVRKVPRSTGRVVTASIRYALRFTASRAFP